MRNYKDFALRIRSNFSFFFSLENLRSLNLRAVATPDSSSGMVEL